MWLVNAKTLQLESFIDDEHAPRYAILSHTWGDPKEEITFHDMNLWATGQIPKGPKIIGWQKINKSCGKALEYNCDYIWIDTCCIDKSSSAELQEAINSMFSYYKKSTVCLVHLVDVEEFEFGHPYDQQFRHARWFTRGWTLQELLAPENLQFFNKSWKNIGDKTLLKVLVEDITGIPTLYLRGGQYSTMQLATIAERMSWAAKRETTRREDIAYCLLGLFDVYMPLLYGEGDRAFLRLQEEILRSNDDHSIHHWGCLSPLGYDDFDFDLERSGGPGFIDDGFTMAPHPNFFRHLPYDLVGPLRSFKSPSFSMGQRGLTARLPLKADPNYGCLAYGILNIHNRGAIAIPLISSKVHVIGHGESLDDEYWRPTWCRPVLLPISFVEGASYKEILIQHRRTIATCVESLPFRLCKPSSSKLKIMGTYPPSQFTTRFISLGRVSSADRFQSYRDSQIGRETLKINTGRLLFHINAATTSRVVPLLLVVDYRIESIDDNVEMCSLECRVFELPESDFSMAQMLAFLTKREDPGQWKALPSTSHEIHEYYYVDASGTCLDIHVTMSEYYIASIEVGLIEKRKQQFSTSFERQPWRFIEKSLFFLSREYVCRGSVEDLINNYPDDQKISIKDMIKRANSPDIKTYVFDDMGLKEELGHGSYEGSSTGVFGSEEDIML
ncbi:hypothetical protein FE257_006521 [Aspergillus nanangensis]|uniref:Heterokaryon incompatibility domain-containing protein n=1 Tax=Aspergillus nanangensis TaxID=2582783 RepID=A0AAD4CZE6_ASPNN|nr:hypothetical protein FE257_006521 [Aspergillus nanangensis]